MIQLLLTIYAGFSHAFEADHLLAVSNIVSNRNRLKVAVKDGFYWGLGHTSTIFIIGILMILFKAAISQKSFQYFEALVGMMLISLAVYRLIKFFKTKKIVVHTHGHQHEKATEKHQHLHIHLGEKTKHQHKHSLAYSVGLVHGLAGSGTLILVVMSQMKTPFEGLIFLLIFGAGCMMGMMLAAGLFSIPFSKKIMQAATLKTILILVSSLLCLLYGGKVIFENLVL